jgi:hypothetical protein
LNLGYLATKLAPDVVLFVSVRSNSTGSPFTYEGFVGETYAAMPHAALAAPPGAAHIANEAKKITLLAVTLVSSRLNNGNSRCGLSARRLYDPRPGLKVIAADLDYYIRARLRCFEVKDSPVIP